MPREKEGYRLNLERINEKFPEREMLRVCDVMSFTGWSRNSVKKRIPFMDGYISKADLARRITV